MKLYVFIQCFLKRRSVQYFVLFLYIDFHHGGYRKFV